MRPAAVVAALGLTLAVGVPAAWVLTRPGAAAGAPVAQALAAPAAEAAAPPAPRARDAAPAPSAPTAAPVRLTVPDLRIDAPVDPVGVTPQGAMDLPGDVGRVGWYRFGPAPGGAGNAVLAGHVDDAVQGLGALAPLRGVAAGAEVLVDDAAGATTRWRVVSRELIGKPELPLAQLFRRGGPARLVLLTCGGEFLPERGSYASNVVVVAEPVP